MSGCQPATLRFAKIIEMVLSLEKGICLFETVPPIESGEAVSVFRRVFWDSMSCGHGY